MGVQTREDLRARNTGSRRNTFSPARTLVPSAVLITVASPGPTPSEDTQVLVAGFTVEEGSMAEAVFTEAEAEGNFLARRK
jgi:hypothetical protein